MAMVPTTLDGFEVARHYTQRTNAIVEAEAGQDGFEQRLTHLR